jgi:hypothetical protein
MFYLYVIRTCRYKKYALAVSLLFIQAAIFAQVKWDGEGNDGQWTNPANWAGDMLPGNTDNVLLDNSYVSGNYMVALPGGMSAVTIKTVSISPSAGNFIQLVLPVSSIAVPAFTATGPGYGITVNSGGVFINASGSSAGAAIVTSDSFRINNGGQYTHNTRSAHAALVTALSTMPGTETGIFKFDVPGGSYTFAAASRTYGILMFNAEASGGSQSYTAIAANPLIINADLVINAGVTVSLDINNNIFINRDYVQNGGTFNIASQPNNNTIFIKRNFIQNSGIITETSTGLPAIEFNGTTRQNLTVSGSITNSVNIRINNPAGVTLLANLSLPYNLDLLNGIVNSNSFLLTLLAGCTINTDSSGNNSFINGPLRKEGLSATPYFLFPVGRGITQRWLELKDATGNYTVEFFKSDPRILANTMGPGIHHISSIEHWTVDADASPVPSAKVELSFDNVNSGAVTDLTKLRVAQLFGSTWADEGNTATTGSAGMAGSVSSNPLGIFGPANKYFTLASSDAFQNPLPERVLSFSGNKTGDLVQLNWQIAASWLPVFFEPEASADGNNFIAIAGIQAVINQTNYRYVGKPGEAALQFYRLKVTEKAGTFFYTETIRIAPAESRDLTVKLAPSVVTGKTTLLMNAATSAMLQIKINDIQGRTLQTIDAVIVQGVNRVPLYLHQLSAGLYLLTVTDRKSKIATIHFVKLY